MPTYNHTSALTRITTDHVYNYNQSHNLLLQYEDRMIGIVTGTGYHLIQFCITIIQYQTMLTHTTTNYLLHGTKQGGGM